MKFLIKESLNTEFSVLSTWIDHMTGTGAVATS